ncbi:hypothetical protein H8E07_12615 [bacterium]|nr:hypothetical protein [bacterium]
MISRTVLVALAVVLICGPVAAQWIDPDPDGMSLYFDEEATIWCGSVDDWVPAIGAGPSFSVYLIVTNPSTGFPSIRAWEARVEITTNSFIPYEGLTLTPGAIDTDPDPDNYVVGCGGLYDGILIHDDTVVLAIAELQWLGFEGTATGTFELCGVEGSLSFSDGPGYAVAPGYLYPCQSFFGTDNWGVCAYLNPGAHECEPIIASENMTWGMVKSLY